MKKAATRKMWAGPQYTAGCATSRWFTTKGSIDLARSVMPTNTRMSVGSARIPSITARDAPMPP